MRNHRGGWRKTFPRRLLPALLCAALLLARVSSAFGEKAAPPPADAETRRQALELFCICAFHPEFNSADAGRLTRWENEITVWAGGVPTREDLAKLDAFLAELREKVPGLPPIRRVRRDAEASVRIWYVQGYMMKYYLDGYVDGNWGFFRYETRRCAITSARIGIASDLTEQEERNHLMMEELVGALGLPGDHTLRPDSILYDGWSTVQALSDLDWRMLNLLYHPALSPGMTEAQVREILRVAQ